MALIPMAPEAAWTRVAASAERLAEELAGTGRDHAAALDDARAALRRLLPHGARTAGHVFAWIHYGDTAVGYVWFGPHPSRPEDRYVYDVEVDPAHRGRGHGGAALEAVAAIAAGDGAVRLGLQVFESNPGAIRLYERLGFVTTRTGEGRREMWRTLPGAGGG